MFRYSLRTLVLLSLLPGAAFLTWKYRTPWNLEELKTRAFAVPLQGNSWDMLTAWAPDGRRLARATYSHKRVEADLAQRIYGRVFLPAADKQLEFLRTRIEILDYKDRQRVLARFDLDEFVYDLSFADDNHLTCLTESRARMYYRNHYEWWWGACARPEVWLLSLASLILLITFIGHVRAQLIVRRARRV